ncbi:hypothetical protein ABZ471_36870 [Streptomyces sp. NPDC005728]|uniref:hypothetical protein n=1 Tax=Streptomyces sp. NPDC005728 TaxID=3157054 RepID=UPI003400FE4A
MIELIRVLVEALTQGLPGLRGIRDDARRRRLGAALFMIYVRLSEAMMTADEIVRLLEDYVAAVRRDDPDAPRYGYRLTPLATKQVADLNRIKAVLREKSVALHVVSSDAYMKLGPFVGEKSNALDSLMRVTRGGQLPLEPGHLARSEPPPDIDRARWPQVAFPTAQDWGPEISLSVVAYLEARKPRDQISEIRDALAALRAALEAHFPVKDVLLELGDVSVDEER